jgi:hypothetical protein
VDVLVAAVAWGGALLIDGSGQALPRVPASAPTVLALFAAILLAFALSARSKLRAWRERQPGAVLPDPMTMARFGVLARASSPVGAGVVGLYAGYGIFLIGNLDEPGRRHLATMSGLTVLAGVALVACALFLERVCRLPEDRGAAVPRPR